MSIALKLILTGRQMDNIHRAYARNERDEKRLIAAGVPARRIYRGDRGVEQWGNWTMRKGEVLGVVNGLLAFGTNRRAMMAALEKAEQGCFVIVDVETQLRSDKHSAKLLDLGLAKRHGEQAMKPGQAESMQEASVAARTKGRMPQRSALVHWRNPELKTKQALKLMRGWSRGIAYKVLGKRGVPSGRPQIEA